MFTVNKTARTFLKDNFIAARNNFTNEGLFIQNINYFNEELKNKMMFLKEETLNLLDKELNKTKSMIPSEIKKLEEIKSLLENDYSKIEAIDETNVIFYMSISKLNEELKETK
jgi:hypothetical protein